MAAVRGLEVFPSGEPEKSPKSLEDVKVVTWVVVVVVVAAFFPFPANQNCCHLAVSGMYGTCFPLMSEYRKYPSVKQTEHCN